MIQNDFPLQGYARIYKFYPKFQTEATLAPEIIRIGMKSEKGHEKVQKILNILVRTTTIKAPDETVYKRNTYQDGKTTHLTHWTSQG